MMNEHCLLVCTVGGTPEAIVAAIKGGQPARIIFIVSPETHQDVETHVIPLLKKQGLTFIEGQYDYFQVPDAQEFISCVERLRELGDEVSRWRARGKEYKVIADFTGGTKCMSATLALVARQWHCQFSYIGGAARNKGGVGVVLSGAEKVLHSQNPWDALGYQVVEDATLLFDRGNYEAAGQIPGESLPAIDRADMKMELNTFKTLSQSYLEWDCFNHQGADLNLSNVQKNANHLRHLFPDTADDILQAVSANLSFLSEILKKPVGKEKLLDLCANAQRCAGKGRYDDAIARLYRVVEAAAQLRLHAKHQIYQCNGNRVPDFSKLIINKLPEPLRSELSKRGRKDGTIGLGLQDDYELLAALKDDLAERFSAFGGEKSPLAARNQSILAHGFVPVEEKVFANLWRKTLALVEVTENQLPAFPRIQPHVHQ